VPGIILQRNSWLCNHLKTMGYGLDLLNVVISCV
jgi:hypothetical protein